MAYDAFVLNLPSPEINILGETIPSAETKTEIESVKTQLNEIRSMIPWMRYRSNFDRVGEKGLTTDNGWGCMIRAGQMMTFVALARVIKLEKKNYHEFLGTFFREKSDGKPLGHFAIQHFVLEAEEEFKVEPGSWFKPTTFVLTLKKILKDLPDFDNLRMYNILDNTIVWRKLEKKAFNSSSQLETKEEVIEKLRTQPWNNSVILTLSSLFGLSRPDELYSSIVISFTKMKSFVGMLGGQANSAYYFIGANSKNNFYYLDPHYCSYARGDYDDEEAVKKDYFLYKVKEVALSKMSTTMTFCFLLSSNEHLQEFHDVYKKLSEELGDDFFICDQLEKTKDSETDDIIETFD